MAILAIQERLTEAETATASLTLAFDLRQKSRLRARLDNGQEVGLLLSRGKVLRHGDCLRAEDGQIIEIRAALETVSTATSEDPQLLARACYHLGNRHVPLQISPTWLRYRHDHVLDEMLCTLGLAPYQEQAPFEPEAGAYHSHATHEHS